MLINMNTLEKRREVAAVLFLFKLLKGLIFAPKILAQCNYNGIIRNYDTNSNHWFFNIKSHRTKYGTFEPINYMCIIFNRYFKIIDFNLSVETMRYKLLTCNEQVNV